MNKHVHPEERQWLTALRENSEQGFANIYNHYWTKLFSVAYNYTRSREAAQEIVQEVFVSLWLQRGSLSVHTSLYGYLLGAVRNRIYDHIDKQTVRAHYQLQVTRSALPLVNSTEEQISFQELEELLAKQVSTLPDTTQRIFILSRFDGFSNSEIAQQMQLSVKAVEYHLTKALKHLRYRLTELLLLLLVGGSGY